MAETTYEKEVLDVRNKVVLIRSKNELSDITMTEIGKRLKIAGAIEVVYCMEEFYDLKIELFGDEDLKLLGLQREVLTNVVVPKKAKTRRPRKVQSLN